MSRLSARSSLPSDSPSSAVEPKSALRHQIDRLLHRKEPLKRNPLVPEEKLEELELFLVELNRLFEGGDFEGAALLYIKCFAVVEELERLYPLTGGHHRPPANIPTAPPPAAPSPPDARANKDSFRPDRFMQFEVPPGRRRSLWNRLTGRGRRETRTRLEGERADEIRDLWNTQIEFFCACLGFIVGGGNTLRFPAMIFEFGGAFFIPYLFFLVVFGLPLVYMHLAIGQFSGLSASGAFFKMMPIASGLGWALVLLAVPVSIYYIFYVAWGFYYLWFALHGMFSDGTPLAWEHCHAGWVQRFNCCELIGGQCSGLGGHTMTAPEAFFKSQLSLAHSVLNRTLDVHNPTMGPIQEHLLVSLVISWAIVFFGVFKGLGSIGWAVSITATVPYFLLIILLLRSISLAGASTGLVYLFVPEIKKLWCLKIWRKAAEQVFYSLGIDAGPLISMAAFSRYRNNIYRDAVLLVFIDTITSVLCGMVIFSFIGFMTTAQGIHIADIQRLDPSYIAFTVYPGVTSYLEWGFIWAILFYIILTLSALDAEFAWLEMIASSIMNQFGSKRKSTENRLLIMLCVFCFLCGIPLCAQGGIYIFHAVENLNSNWNSFSLSLIQVLIVCQFYGVDKFLEDIAGMLRTDENPPASVLSSGQLSREQFLWRRCVHFFGPTGGYIKWMWSLFAPVVLTLLLFFSVLGYERVKFNGVPLPFVYELIAWIVMTGPLLMVPTTAIYNIWDAHRKSKPLRSVLSADQWRRKEADEEESRQPKHTQQNENNYAYIDPLSRGASAKSRKVVTRSSTERREEEEDKYSQLRERLKRWETATEESVSASALGRSLTDRPEVDDDDEEDREQELEGRMPGRLADWRAPSPSEVAGQQPLPAPDLLFRQSGGSATETQSDSPFLFGPPPMQPPAAVSIARSRRERESQSAIEMAELPGPGRPSAQMRFQHHGTRQRLKRPKPIEKEATIRTKSSPKT